MAKKVKKSRLQSGRGSSKPAKPASGKTPSKYRKKTKIVKSAKRGKVLTKKKNTLKKKTVANKIVKKVVQEAKKQIKKKVIKKTKVVAKKIVKKAVKKSLSKKVKHTVRKPSPVPEFQAESLFKAKIKVIGIGGGGGSIVSEIGRSLKKATFVIADTDIRALKKKSGIKYFWFGEKLTHGLGTGVNVDLAKQAAESAKDKISGFFKDQDIVIFVASLGGGLGSGATQVFADAAREFGGITLGIFTMPFKFEGKNKYRIAQNALKSLRKSLNVSLVIPNEKIFKIIDTSTPITNAFSTVNKSLIGSLESLIDLIYNPGIINIDFADLRTILKGRGNSAFLNTVEESGKDRVEKICENIFKNPLLQNNAFKAEKILFNIAGGSALSMFEVEKISSHISNLNPKAKIIFGISKEPKLKNKVKTTILMTDGQIENPVSEKSAEEPIKTKEKKEKIGFVPEKKEVVKKKEEKPKKIEKAKQHKKKKSSVKRDKKPIVKPAKDDSQIPVSLVPVQEEPVLASSYMSLPIVEQKRAEAPEKKAIRRNALEIKKAEELQEKKKMDQEKEWEIPAFLRKVKFKG